jgi:Zn-dependent protease
MFNSSLLSLLFTEPSAFVVIFGGILLAIGFHEAAHCYMADYLGDPTPRSLGRTTLNPLAHLDPMGTLVLLITGAFGWGKSSPFDPYNLKNPTRDTALIALAGPASNLIMAILLSLLIRFIPAAPSNISLVLRSLVAINVSLAIFNLLPVPPLDGSKVFLRRNPFTRDNSYLLLLLLILPIFGGFSLASLVISPISMTILQILLP